MWTNWWDKFQFLCIKQSYCKTQPIYWIMGVSRARGGVKVKYKRIDNIAHLVEHLKFSFLGGMCILHLFSICWNFSLFGYIKHRHHNNVSIQSICTINLSFKTNMSEQIDVRILDKTSDWSWIIQLHALLYNTFKHILSSIYIFVWPILYMEHKPL